MEKKIIAAVAGAVVGVLAKDWATRQGVDSRAASVMAWVASLSVSAVVLRL